MRWFSMKTGRPQYILCGLITAVVYLATAKWGLTLAFVADQVTVVWPPTGIALCAIILFGNRIWPAIAVASFIANVTTNTPVAASIGIAAGNTLEAIVGAYLLRRTVGFRPSLERFRDAFALILCGALFSTAVAATIGVVSLCLTGVQPWNNFSLLWGLWYLGDAMGDVIVAPLVLTLASGEARRRLYSRGLPSFLGLVVILVALQFLLFDRRIPLESPYHSPVYVVFPLLIFAALRFGTCGTAITIFITASIAILKTVQGLGPFALGSTHQNLISLQLFMFVAACTSLIMAVSETRSEAAKASLDRSEQRYRSLVLATTQVVWSTDSRGEVIEDLPTWEAFTGQSKEEVAGRGWITKVHPDDLQRVMEVWDRSLAHGTPHEIEFRVLSAAGRYRNVLGRAVPILESNGTVREWVGTLSDITDKKRTEEELRQSNRRKDEFLAMLAHELRNPLAPIRNAIEIIRVSKRDPERVDRTCDLMERQVHNMSRLLDDLLDIARITRGQIELRKEPTDLRTLVERSVEAIRPTADKKALQLTADFERVPVPVSADVTRLEQVVTNLLNNAVKFTPAGGRVIVRLIREKEEAVLRVCDNGRGIEPDLLPNIFELFVQGDRSLARSEGGLGIGLTLAQNLVRMHSGTIAAASGGAGFGSEFTVRLPLMSGELLPEVSKTVQTAVAGQRKRVLVVEDNTDSAETLAAMLDIMGHEAHIAHDGQEGLAEVARLNPSVVLLDIGLPGMTGFEVAEQLRSSNSNHSLMLIALTGYGSDTDRARSKAAGFDHHLVKPVDFGILEKLLNL